MTTVVVNKRTLIGTGYVDLPVGGRRFRYHVERYRDDDGEEWGKIVSVEQIPDVGPYLWIPSYAVSSPDETEYLLQEHEYEQAHPDPQTVEWWAEHRAEQKRRMTLYDEARDARAAHIRRNPVTKGRS